MKNIVLKNLILAFAIVSGICYVMFASVMTLNFLFFPDEFSPIHMYILGVIIFVIFVARVYYLINDATNNEN